MLRKSYMLLVLCCLTYTTTIFAQQERWQQRVEYDMDIKVDVEKYQYTGTQKLVYYNNSNETLDRVFYHLYFNAFQPGSMMDVRSRTIADPDPRVSSRIAVLKENEIGYLRVKSLKQDGEDVAKFEEVGTILEVKLKKPIPPNSKVVLDMEFEGQVPVQIRRSGRQSKEGIEFSMSQWYPKLCEYDYQGWHSNPYIGREFHGVWGDFSVKINIDENYTVAGSGYLQDKNTIGHGYEDTGVKVPKNPAENNGKLTWHFIAPNVHDFVWAADPDYLHDVVEINDTMHIHFFYQDEDDLKVNWAKAQPKVASAFKYIQKRFGTYPYRQYSIIQGGDGGMEYPMATLITGKRGLGSLVGVSVHEIMHTWYQMLLGTNESLYPWMDEGFTTYSSNEVMSYLGFRNRNNPHKQSYGGYFNLAKSAIEEPMSTHADHYYTNSAYGAASYNKGCVFLRQLEYVVGEAVVMEGMLDYYNQWRFKHPNPNDFIRIMEKRSGLELDWYKEYFVNSIHTIDYGIKEVKKDGKNTIVVLERRESIDKETGKLHGGMPMPIDLVIDYAKKKDDVVTELYYIPMRIMRGEKKNENKYNKHIVLKDWAWTDKTYELVIPHKLKDIKKITIDPSARLADVFPKNNVYPEVKEE
ncbi:MAG: M1 family metallopeptidase [Saprospiraceae bacterium]|nr:M1 family metallopeptidase [Saprospiraceae bacterium]